MLTLASLASTPWQDDTAAVTELALMLDQAMANDADARARYLAIHGTEWAPLATARVAGIRQSALAVGTSTKAL